MINVSTAGKKSMKGLHLAIIFLLSTLFANGQLDLIGYVGNTGRESFTSILPLSDGTYLVAGTSSNLDWLPHNCPVTSLNGSDAINNITNDEKIGFILHLDEGLQQIIQVVHLPVGKVESIDFIKTNGLLGERTKQLYISGKFHHEDKSGFYIARLNGNFIDQIPKKLSWTKTITSGKSHLITQPWDIDHDGNIYVVEGIPYDQTNDLKLLRLKAENLSKEVIENWRTHEGIHVDDGAPISGHWTPAFAKNNVTPRHSYVLLSQKGCALRSWSSQAFNANGSDATGKPRKGHWPLDHFFATSCDPSFPSATQHGPGFTGLNRLYQENGQVAGVQINKLNGDIYLGINFKAATSQNNQINVPVIIAWKANGVLKWWDRLYNEGTTAGVNCDKKITALQLNPAQTKITVLAQQKGITDSPLYAGSANFKNNYTGIQSNDVGWLGNFSCNDGKLINSTFLTGVSSNSPQGSDRLKNASGFTDMNIGNPDMQLCYPGYKLSVNEKGQIALGLRSQYFPTTDNAYQEQGYDDLEDMGTQKAFSEYVVVLNDKLDELVCSSLLSAEWDRKANMAPTIFATSLLAFYPTDKGVIVLGQHNDINRDGIPDNSSIPFHYQKNTTKQPIDASMLAWGKNELQKNDGQTALLAYLTYNKKLTASFSQASFTKNCIGSKIQMKDESFSFSGIASWKWDFGVDANPQKSTSQNPEVSWLSAGLKNISLIVTDSTGQSDSISQSYQFNLLPKFTFEISSNTEPISSPLQLSAQGSDDYQYTWKITNPTTNTIQLIDGKETEVEIDNALAEGSLYLIELTATNGSCQKIISKQVTVFKNKEELNASFSVNTTTTDEVNVCTAQTVSFASQENQSLIKKMEMVFW